MASAVWDFSEEQLIPTQEECSKIVNAMLEYEAAKSKPDYETWKNDNKNWNKTPWGISWNVGKASYDKKVSRGWKATKTDDKALRIFIVAVIIGWQDLIDQMKKALKYWEISADDIKWLSKNTWCKPENANKIIHMCEEAFKNLTEQVIEIKSEMLIEAVEKHDTLNRKLFTKDNILKETVRKKMLEIVNEFITNLQEQNIEIKVDDVLLVGSNANYNYTKDSDIDLHIIANTKKIKYEDDVADALYSAYRSLFNKNLDINIYDIPLELYVETENTPRNSNGVYSVKKDKWEKKPVQEEIPEYDIDALNKLVDKWEKKCKDLLDKIDADKLKDEKQVVKLIEDIYEKLRKTGIAKSEYAIENLAFKELRNKGYLDKLKDSKHKLISKRLSLEEKLDRQSYLDIYNQLHRVAGTQPIIQPNGMFFIYNLKPDRDKTILKNIQKLPFVSEAHANETKYDFSNTLDLAMGKLPEKYYDIRGTIKI